MHVRDIMITDVVSCSVAEPLQTAVGKMLDAGVGSVIVTREGNPTGIVTETDVLWEGYDTGRCFENISVEEAMSHPLVTIAPDRTVQSASRKMIDDGIKKLAVVDGLDLVGIITLTDLVSHEDDLLDQAHREEAQRLDWEL
ncbi:CBS domain-containing protein [Haloarculaceae archaeon H-GB2-1]|nr:CBS domain-containing protein [Haloarculaceae archaeon H-GB1-1]MEA5386147.1 CBS domain-containing protein [Haloarculaceae archaeon H-GB11]MEA5407652.1 CBS domain-containing protein [Haloarculaceae archaeon H-GB2-1]